MTDYDALPFEKQNVWRTHSKHSSAGYFVWEVLELMDLEVINGELEDRLIKQFHVTLDGGYIHIMCYHFWTKEGRDRFESDASFSYTQNVHLIPDLKYHSCCKALKNGPHKYLCSQLSNYISNYLDQQVERSERDYEDDGTC